MNNMQYRPPMGLQTLEERQMGLFLHLSQLGFLIPAVGILIGILGPILIWQTQKDKMPELDAHGKMVVNFMISRFIYAIVCVPLVFLFFVGLIGIFALLIIGIVFPIIGAVKANQGELWDYPLTIKFLK